MKTIVNHLVNLCNESTKYIRICFSIERSLASRIPDKLITAHWISNLFRLFESVSFGDYPMQKLRIVSFEYSIAVPP